MAISIDLGSAPNSTNGDTLYEAFTIINTAFSTTTKLTNGDLQFNGVKIGKGAGNITGNTAVGDVSLNSNTTGQNNTAIGYASLNKNQAGSGNTAIGLSALELNISGNNNTAVGFIALQKSVASDNTAIGTNALLNNINGVGNTAIGVSSARSNQDGHYNTSLGFDSLFSNINGVSNTAIGRVSLYNTTGNNNTGIGYYAGSEITNQVNSTCLGHNAQVLGSNQVQLGDANTTPYAYQALSLRSDLRDKTQVRDTVLGLDFINELRPVDYKWDMREDYKTEMPTQGELSDEDFKIVMDEWIESVKLDNITHDGTHTRTRYHHGLIAQEVQDVIVASGVDFGGFQDHSVAGGQDVLSIGYTELIAPMIKAIQELTARINVLEGN